MVVSSSRQKLCNLRPLVTILLVSLYNFVILLFGPLVLLDIWVQMIVPSLTALLANSTWQGLSYVAPVFGSKHMHIFREFIVLLYTPRTFHHRRIQHFLPPVQTLHISPLMQERCYAFPVFGTKSLNQLCQLLVFFCVPVSLIIMRILICDYKCVNMLLRLNCLIRRIHILQSKAWILLSSVYQTIGFL